MVAATVIQGASTLLKNRYVQFTIVGVVVILVVYLIVKKSFKGVQDFVNDRNFDKNETSDVSGLIQRYRSAMNPSGVSWMIAIDGTNEQAILDLAQETKGSFDDVAKAYKKKFDSNLTDDLRDELSSELFETWYEIINE